MPRSCRSQRGLKVKSGVRAAGICVGCGGGNHSRNLAEAPDVKLPEPADIAESIRRIQEATQKLLKAGLNNRALLVLLKDSSGVSMHDIDKVLASLGSLAATYTEARRKADK